MANELDQLVLAKAEKWLTGEYDEATKKQVKYLIDNDKTELTESFYKDLEFGTGGLRGIMGVGTNRMNIYTVGFATQGLANYLKKNFAGEEIRVAIGHDSRNNSRMFAEHVADIFASNGFKVFLFDALRPTPELSFAIRELKCQSGVVVTASHNPKEYNGYKAYWSDGSQVTEPHDKNIIAEVEKITSVSQVMTGLNKENITILGEDFDEKYLDRIHELSLSPESVKKFHDLVRSLRVEAGHRFVGKHDFRLLHECSCYAHALLLAAGKASCGGEGEIFHAYAGKTGVCLFHFCRRGGKQPLEQGMKTYAAVERVSQRRLPQDELMLLKNEAGLPAEFPQFSGRIDRSDAAHADAAFRDGTEQVEATQKGGFAGSRRAEKDRKGARGEMKGRRMKRRRRTVTFGDVCCLKHKFLLENRRKLYGKYDPLVTPI